MAYDVCRQTRMSQGIDKMTSLPLNAYRNMHIQNAGLSTTNDSFIYNHLFKLSTFLQLQFASEYKKIS